jgi:hypothetical protein
MAKTGLIALALLLATPAAAQDIPDTTMLTAAEPERIAQAIRFYGRPAQLETDEAGEPTIATGFGGIRARIWFYDCTEAGKDCVGLQFQLGIGTVRKLTLQQVNAFNRGRRFATLSLDEEGDPILTHDLSMARPGISAASFRDTLQLFDTQATELRQMVEELERAAPAPGPTTR